MLTATSGDQSTRMDLIRPNAITVQNRETIGTKKAQAQDAKIVESKVENTLKPTPSRQSLKREPQLDRENFVNGHIKKFLAHVETREIKKHISSDPRENQLGTKSSGIRSASHSQNSDQ